MDSWKTEEGRTEFGREIQLNEMTRSQTSKAPAGLAEIFHTSLVACISDPENCLFFQFLYSSLLQLQWPSFQNHSQPSKSSLLLGHGCWLLFFFLGHRHLSKRHCHPSYVPKPEARVCVRAQPCLTATPWTEIYQAPVPMNFLGRNTGVHCHFLLHLDSSLPPFQLAAGPGVSTSYILIPCHQLRPKEPFSSLPLNWSAHFLLPLSDTQSQWPFKYVYHISLRPKMTLWLPTALPSRPTTYKPSPHFMPFSPGSLGSTHSLHSVPRKERTLLPDLLS